MSEAANSLVSDVRPPREIARLVETTGVAKANLNLASMLLLSVLAGAFISLGAMLFIVVTTGSTLGFGMTRLVGGLAFCLGLILVVLAGGELFTGNNLIAMAWASRLVSTPRLLTNWLWVYVGNVVGCLGTVALVCVADLGDLAGGAVRVTACQVAHNKMELGWLECVARGVLCNALVCLAVWLTMGARSAADKILAILFPITAFVTMGLEHSIANWFFLPLGLAWDASGTLTIGAALINLACATAGNIVGGTLLVAGVYWLAYLRPMQTSR